MGFDIPVPMHHSGWRKALYLLGPCGVTLMASWNDGLTVDMNVIFDMGFRWNSLKV
jgi:hypothetical protein